MSKKTSRRAFSYVRFSTARQADGGSLKRQTDLTEAYCQRKGLTLDDSLHLQDLGVSAFRGSNVKDGALAGFLEACRVGRVPKGSYLIVESLDRLSRDQIRPALQLFLGLQDFGVTIVTLQPEREYPPEATDALALIEPLIVFARAHEESQMKSHRRKDGWRQARDKARRGGGPMLKTCPAWLEVTPDGFRVKEEAAAVVKRIFDLCREGYGVQRITSKLIRDGVPPFGNGGKWVRAYVYRILANPAAMGTYQPCRYEGNRKIADGEPIPGYYPAIISEEEWREAQTAMMGRDGGFELHGRGSPAAGRKGVDDSEASLFTGLVRDAKAGLKMHIAHSLGRKVEGERKRYLYLMASPETGEKGRRVDYNVFEAAVLSLFKELRPADILPAQTTAKGHEMEATRLSGRLLDLDSRIERAKARARKAEDFDAFLDLIESMQTERRQVSARLAELEEENPDRVPADLGETQSLIDLLAKAKGGELNDLRRRLKNRIRQLVAEMVVLIVPRGRNRLTAVQMWFKGSERHRDYLILHNREGHWCRSLASVTDAEALDLRVRDHARRLEKVLSTLPLGD